MKFNRKQIVIGLVILVILVTVGLIFVKNRFSADTNQVVGLEDNLVIWNDYCNGKNADGLTSYSLTVSQTPFDGVIGDAKHDCSGTFRTQLKDGRNTLMIPGDKAKQIWVKSNLTIDSNGQAILPNQKYKISYDTKIENRKCFDISGLDYTAYWKDGGPNNDSKYLSPFHIQHGNTHGDIFCGYDGVTFRGNSGDNAAKWLRSSYLFLTGTIYLQPANRDWFPTTTYLTSGANDNSMDIALTAGGLDGTVYFDNVRVEKVPSFVQNADLIVPIKTKKIAFPDQSFPPACGNYPDLNGCNGANNFSIKTQTTEFKFNDSSIEAINLDSKKSLGIVDFGENGLKDLYRTTTIKPVEYGFINLHNTNVLLTIGADSTITIRMTADKNFQVKQIPTAFSLYRDGLLFARNTDETDPTNYGPGIYFSPILGEADYQNYYCSNSTTKCLKANGSADSASNDWHLTLSQQNWWPQAIADDHSLSYTAKNGDAYLLSAFPVKPFSQQDYCNNRLGIAKLSLEQYASPDQLKQNVNMLSNYFKTIVLWEGAYDRPPSNTVQFDPAPLGDKLYGGSPSTTRPEMKMIDGPNSPLKPQAKNYVQEFHDFGKTAVGYLGPEFFRERQASDSTNSTDIYDNISQIVNSGLDGVYLDGYMWSDPFSQLIFARKVRNILGDDKIYIQHASGNRWFMGSHDEALADFKLPFADAYADMINTGESQTQNSDDMYKNHYSSYQASNTPQNLQFESNRKQTPQIEIANELKAWGQMRLDQGENQYAMTVGGYMNNQMADTTIYTKAITDKCLPLTKDNGTCDLNENYDNATNDCAPKNSAASITSDGNKYTVTSAKDIANWKVGDNTSFALHYLFDDPNYLYDSSKNKFDPNIKSGTNDTNNLLPTYKSVDGRGTYLFDSDHASRITGYYGLPGAQTPKYLNLTNQSFSLFASIKQKNVGINDSEIRKIYSIGASGDQFFFGTKNNSIVTGRLTGSSASCISGAIDQDPANPTWHMIGMTYDQDTKEIKLYIDGTLNKTCSNVQTVDQKDYYFFNIGGRIDNKNTPEDQTDDKIVESFQGYMDDLFLSLYAMDDHRIADFYADGSGSKYLKTFTSYEGSTPIAILENGLKQYIQASP